MPNWCTAKIVEKKIWSDGLFTIRVNAPDVQPFQAGQFLQLGVYPPGKDGQEDAIINRPYSVASPHGQDLDFFIVVVPDGELTPRLWELNVGDSLLINDKGAGRFMLEKTPNAKHLWLVATGTGLAPYIAMLRTEQPWQRFEKIVVVHGVRFERDLAYTQELKSYQTKYPGRFSLVQTLTRETSEGLQQGRVPSLLESGELERAAECELSVETSAIMLCGNPAMLDSMETLLGQRQMVKHRSKSPGQIVLERYW